MQVICEHRHIALNAQALAAIHSKVTTNRCYKGKNAIASYFVL